MGEARSNQDPQLQKRRASAISFEKSRNLLENEDDTKTPSQFSLQKRGSSSSDNKNAVQSSDKNPNQKRFKGRVSSMLDNYGFIKRLENLPEIFFHYSAVNPEV